MEQFDPDDDMKCVFFLAASYTSRKTDLEKTHSQPLIIPDRILRSTFITSAAHVKASYYHWICTCSPSRCSQRSDGLKGWNEERGKLWNQKMRPKKTLPIFKKCPELAVSACATCTGLQTMYKPKLHVKRPREALHLCTYRLINSVSNWCEGLHWEKW